MKRARANAYLAVLAATGLGTAYLFLSRVPPLKRLLERLLVPLALSLPISLAALGAGYGAQRALARALLRGAAETEEPGPLWLDFALGLPLFGSACFLMALGSTAPLPLALLSLLFAALGVLGLVRHARAGAFAPALGRAPFAFVAAALGIGLILAQLPPSTLDEVAYHLAVPKTWALEGRVVELPLNSHSYFPFGIESAALPLLALFGDLGATSFHFVILASFASALGLVHAWLADYDSERGAQLATVAVATTPALLLTSGTGWIDAPFLGVTIGLCMALERAARSDFTWPSLTPVVAAVAAGTLSKYTWAAVLVVTFGAAAVHTRGRIAQLARLSACALLGLLLGSVFFVRNLVWAGNPVAPFLDASTPHVSAFNQGSTAVGLLLNYVSDPLMVDESLGAALLALTIAFVLVPRGPSAFARPLGLLAAAMLCVVGGLGAAGRILAPFLTIAGGLGAVVALRALEPAAQAKRVLSALVLGISALQLLFVVSAASDKRPFAVLSGGDATILMSARPSYPAVVWLNQNLPPDSRTLVLGIHESYWFDKSVRTGGNFDGPRVAAYLRAASPERLYQKLKRDGFTHVAVYARNLLVGAAPSSGRRAETKTALDDDTANLLRRALGQYATKLGEQHGVALLALR